MPEIEGRIVGKCWIGESMDSTIGISCESMNSSVGAFKNKESDFEMILTILNKVDPMEQNRILDNITEYLKRERIEKLGKAKAEVLKYEQALEKKR